MAYTRIHRLFRLVTLIQSSGAMTPAKLAEACGVDERTVFRDLNELEAVGIPITFDAATQGYRIRGDYFFLPPVQLTPDEALALAVLCEQIAGTQQIAFLSPAGKAMSKVLAALPDSVRADVAALSRAVTIQTAQAGPPDAGGDMYEMISRAIGERRALVCTYQSSDPGAAPEEFDFEPYALFFSVRAWYAIGHHGGREERRSLKLARFLTARLTHRPYEIPADFTLEDHLGNAWRMIRGAPDVSVKLRFDSSFAPNIRETLWHRTQRLTDHDDGSVTFECTVSGLDEIVWWVLSHGPHCTALAPDELRERIRALSAMTAAQYA